jgi:hypothetical protein
VLSSCDAAQEGGKSKVRRFGVDATPAAHTFSVTTWMPSTAGFEAMAKNLGLSTKQAGKTTRVWPVGAELDGVFRTCTGRQNFHIAGMAAHTVAWPHDPIPQTPPGEFSAAKYPLPGLKLAALHGVYWFPCPDQSKQSGPMTRLCLLFAGIPVACPFALATVGQPGRTRLKSPAGVENIGWLGK